MILTEYTVRHRFATAAIVLALVVLGVYGFLRLPVDLLPSITYPLINEGEIDIQLVPRAKRNLTTEQYIARLKKRLDEVPLPAGRAMVMPMKMKGIRQVGESELEVKIKGQDTETLFRLANRAEGIMSGKGWLKNVFMSLEMTKPEYQLLVDRERAGEIGVSVADVAEGVRTLIFGGLPTRYRDGDDYYPIRLVMPEAEIAERRDVERLPLVLPDGSTIRVADVARVAPAVGPVEIVREDQVKQVIVRADSNGIDVAEAERRLLEALEAVTLPPGYEMKLGGQVQMMNDMKRALGNLEEGGDLLQPMAVAAIGGILATILVTLFLVPALYVLVDRFRARPEAAANEGAAANGGSVA